jgi:hypothetical protein
MINELRVGALAQTDGSQLIARAGKTGETVVADAHPRYYEATSRSTTYNGAITGQVTTVGLATTYTGLCLSNPVASPVNLVVTKVGYAFTVAFAAVAAIGLATGYNIATNVTHTAAVTPRNNRFNGSGGGWGLLDSSATLPTAPTLNTIFNAGSTATAAVPPLVSGFVDLEGSIILPPGAYMILYTSAASGAAGGSFSFTWEEVAVI